MFVRWMTMNCLIDKERVEDVRTANGDVGFVGLQEGS